MINKIQLNRAVRTLEKLQNTANNGEREFKMKLKKIARSWLSKIQVK
jgi:hypothetical protein